MARKLNELDATQAWQPFEPTKLQPWSRPMAAHLYRRAGFAANDQQLDEAVEQPPTEVVDRLLNPPHVAAFNDEMNSLARTLTSNRDANALSSWWLYRMMYTPDQLREKTTLFWHGHFATSAAKVEDARLMLEQHLLLRKHALESFEAIVQGISRDSAMLIYLDSTENRKLRPNENYARELLELFCLGLDNYTERDIQQIARCFTGWEVRRHKFHFNKYQHDNGQKSFFDASGDFNGEQAVQIVLDQPAAPRFIARKLVRYFATDDDSFHDAFLDPLARQLREDEFQIGPTVRRILTSQFFFSPLAIGRKTRSPIELTVGTLRALQATTNADQLAQLVRQLGHAPFFPPNVKGWEGGRTWINAATVLGRTNAVRRILIDNKTRFATGDMASLAEQRGAITAEQKVDWLLELLTARTPPPEARQLLVKFAESDSGNVNQQLTRLVQAISSLPEFQLT